MAVHLTCTATIKEEVALKMGETKGVPKASLSSSSSFRAELRHATMFFTRATKTLGGILRWKAATQKHGPPYLVLEEVL